MADKEKKPIDSGTIVAFIILCIFIPIIGVPILIIYLVSHTQETTEFIDNVGNKINEKIEEVKASHGKPKKVKCKYCGNKCSSEDGKCPSCGAPLD